MNLNEKVKTGLIFAIVIILFFIINSNILWFLLFAIACILAYKEAVSLFMCEKNYLFIALALFLTYISNKAIVSMIIVILTQASIIAYKQKNLKDSLPLIYAGLGISGIYEVYLLDNIRALFWLVLSVASCDSFAYFVGKKFGKTPFCPTSPNKTLEGVIGGVVISTILSSIYASYMYEFSFYTIFIISLFMALFAVFGDLFESYLKRLAGVKDSANLFAGHGGVLDRVDALIFSSFVLVMFL